MASAKWNQTYHQSIALGGNSGIPNSSEGSQTYFLKWREPYILVRTLATSESDQQKNNEPCNRSSVSIAFLTSPYFIYVVATAGKSISEETLILRSNIEELNHKLATIDKSISTLSHLVNEFIRGETAGQSSIARPSTFLPNEENNLSNRKKRHLDDERTCSGSARQCRRVQTPDNENGKNYFSSLSGTTNQLL